MAEKKLMTVEQYLDSFPADTKEKLATLRDIIRQAAPDAKEKLAWGAPTYYYNGYLVQFAGYKNHIGFYTSPSTIAHFKDELKGYETNSKNTLKLSIEGELPDELIRKMTAFRIRENEETSGRNGEAKDV